MAERPVPVMHADRRGVGGGSDAAPVLSVCPSRGRRSDWGWFGQWVAPGRQQR